MTTQKAQRKIKTSTVAITVLSILLAIAVVSTIVLAAFSLNREATTNITFGGGVTLNVTGITGPTDPYHWNANVGGTQDTDGSVTDMTADQNVTLQAVTATVTGQAAYIAVKATITRSGANTTAPASIDPNYEEGVIDLTKITNAGGETVTSYTGWMVVGADGSATVTNNGSAALLIDVTTIFDATANDANVYANATYNCEVQIAAGDTIATLLDAIDELSA